MISTFTMADELKTANKLKGKQKGTDILPGCMSSKEEIKVEIKRTSQAASHELRDLQY